MNACSATGKKASAASRGFGTFCSESTACSATDTSLNCRLVGLLHWLEAAATILAIVLIVVIAVAVHLFRKNRDERKAGR